MNEEYNRKITVGEYIHQRSECSKNDKKMKKIRLGNILPYRLNTVKMSLISI